jgi:acetylglutamate kinase
VNSRLLRKLLDDGYLPVLASLGADNDGNIYNINADTVATSVAVDLDADKVILLTSAPGLLADADDPASLISHISARRCEELLDAGTVKGGMVPKLQTLVECVRKGVPRAHILDGTAPHSLLIELFTKHGTGTMVTTSEEERRYLDE